MTLQVTVGGQSFNLREGWTLAAADTSVRNALSGDVVALPLEDGGMLYLNAHVGSVSVVEVPEPVVEVPEPFIA